MDEAVFVTSLTSALIYAPIHIFPSVQGPREAGRLKADSCQMLCLKLSRKQGLWCLTQDTIVLTRLSSEKWRCDAVCRQMLGLLESQDTWEEMLPSFLQTVGAVLNGP